MSRRSPVRRALGPAMALVAFGATAPGSASAQSTAGRPELEAVNFIGNDTFESDSLARAIVNKETACRSVFVQPMCWLDFDFSISEGYLNRREVARDALRLRIYYQQRGFRETLVDTATVVAEDGETATLTFEIDEGQPVVVDTIFIEGLDGYDGPAVTTPLPIDEGDRLSTLVLDAARDSIRRRLQNNGYANAEVLRSWRIEADDRYAADVTFDVYTGPVSHYGTITIVGNDELSDETILRTLQFAPGDVYDRGQLRRAQARLFGLEIIRNAQVADSLDPEALEPDSVVDITVTVAEGDTHLVRTGTGWNSAECVNAEGRWTHRNLLGGARRLQVRGRVGNIGAQQVEQLCWDAGGPPFNQLTWLLAADLSQPWIFSTRNSFQAGIFGERQSVPDVFVREAVGVSFAVTRAIGPRTPLVASYRPELSRLDAAEFLFCTTFLVCRPQDIDVLQGANWLAPVGLSMTRSTTDNVLNPSQGYTLNVSLEHGSALTGSNFRFDRAETIGTFFTQPTDGGLILGFRARGGWVTAGVFDELIGDDQRGNVEIVHPQKRFYSGGANSVRGYGQNRLGPKVLTVLPIDVGRLFAPVGEEGGAGCTPQEVIALVCDASELDRSVFTVRPTGGTAVMEANVEARVPFGPNVQAAAFVDLGRMWQAGGFQDSPFVVSPGVGMRYMSAIGPIRLDVAYRFEGASDLQVVTTQIRPYNEAAGDVPDDRISYDLDGSNDPVHIDYVPISQLALLKPLVTFEAGSGFLQRFQIHLSLGQAF